MLKKLLVSLALISAVAANSAQAVIVCGEGLQEGTIKVIVAGDVHRDYPGQNRTEKQREDLLQMAQKHKIFCIVEDRAAYQGSDKKIKKAIGNLYYSPKDMEGMIICSPIFGFCANASHNQISTVSCEFRYASDFMYDSQIAEAESMIYKLERSGLAYKNNVFRKYLDETIESFNSFQEKDLKEFNVFSDIVDKLLELNVIYEFINAMKKNEHTNFFIAVGLAHLGPIVTMLQSILKFKTIDTAFDMDCINIPPFFDSVFNKTQSQAMDRINNTLNHLQPKE